MNSYGQTMFDRLSLNKVQPEVRRRQSEIEEIEHLIESIIETRYNIITGIIEYSERGSNKFLSLTDYVEKSLWRKIVNDNTKCTPQTLHNILNSDFSKPFDPIEDYFENLPKWDEKTDYIQLLSDSVTTQDQKFWCKGFRKWFISSVACALKKAVNESILILVGNQGVGKSTWLGNLIPQPLKNYRYSGAIRPDNKDTLIHLAECFQIGLDELDSLTKFSVESIKQLTSTPDIRLRRPYGKNAELLVRRASFVGSTNNTEFLHDTTGSRRFLCSQVIEISREHGVNIDLAYAQAYHLVNNGYQHWFSKEEEAEIQKHNESFQIRTAEEDYLLKYLAPAGDEGTFLSASEILDYLNTKANGSIKGNAVSMGKALTKNGFVSRKSKGLRGYNVRYINE